MEFGAFVGEPTPVHDFRTSVRDGYRGRGWDMDKGSWEKWLVFAGWRTFWKYSTWYFQNNQSSR